MRKSIALIITCMIILSGTATVYGTDYTDVTSRHWAFEAVNAMSEKAIIKGYPNGSFLPDKRVTYGEFIKMALIAGTGTDVGNAPSGHWASGYYNQALELKYFNLYDINKAQLGSQIPRGDMALIISSVLGDLTIENYDEIQKNVKDVDYQTKHEYDITKAFAAGILTGYTDHTFRPEGTLSRAESAAVIHRLVDESKRKVPGGEVIETTQSAITHPTSELLDMAKLTPDKTITKSAHFTNEYEICTNSNDYRISLFKAWDGNGCAFDHTLLGFIYLVKNKEIVDYCNTTPKFDVEGNYLHYQRSISHYDISKVDYIISVPSTEHFNDTGVLIKAVNNPFKQ